MGRPRCAARVARAFRRVERPAIRVVRRGDQARPPAIMKLPMLSTDEKIAEIKRLYFRTTRQTVQEDLAKALDLLKSMPSEEDRERATVFMEGLAEMRRDWSRPALRGKPRP